MSAPTSLFLLVDGGMKLAKPAIVLETTLQLGYRSSGTFRVEQLRFMSRRRSPNTTVSSMWAVFVYVSILKMESNISWEVPIG
jgi:hypothetical protein